ncbi:molybdopterin oxidoreductase [Dickeya parazeae Ech586]|uniref:Molybdopterin oxidoreductase n=1 Tax=Dickeya zeae (strain Ech586) TaxID=590409 RepID=D2BRZ5_DICZ5|nr:nitrate reductase [Dickeya parazeae]ACZ77542.1 molybdopterin oxidoreductase [Dickeya parazeae Ech586]
MTDCRTTCPYCGVGCGVIATAQPDGRVTIKGDSQHPANQGRLCVKGSALGDTLSLQGRLLWPLVDGQRVSWDQALDRVAQSLGDIIAQHGPQAVAFYGSGQLLTEDYYVANKLMKGFIGSANMDTNSRLCMASAVIGYKRALGADAVPGNYEDIEQADLVVLVGSNTAWAHPVVYQRLMQAKQQRPHMKVVVVDPRHTATCDAADLHLPLAPGSDAGLFNGLLHWLAQQSAPLPDALSGVEAALAAADEWTVEQVAEFCRLRHEDITRFYQWFSETGKVVTLYSQGINQSASGSDKCNAIINVHLFSGRIGRVGCGPFSITGQPNAMGGREVGGLANQLAAHMGFSPQEVARVGRFWGSDRVASAPGLMAVDLFRAIEAGQVKAVWIMGTNPVVSMPEADRVRQALLRCSLVIVSDVMRHTDTTECADILLPALAWGEKDGTVTNSERRISRQRAFLPAPGEAKADWWIVSQVATRMGFGEAFDYRHPAQIFREHAALSGFENQGQRAFNISALATLSDEQWQQLAPVQWPVTPHANSGTARLYADGRCWHSDGKARLLAITPQLPVNPPSPAYPLVLNTGRVRDQWHTMTRTGKAARLMQHLPEPYCDLHPQDALNAGVHDGELVRISAGSGWMLVRAQVQRGQQPGSIFVPMHWNRQFSAQARVDSLVAAVTDPYSGQPESKQARVRIQRWPAVWFGELFVRGDVAVPDCGYWSRITADGVSHYVIADERTPEHWLDWLTRQYDLSDVEFQQTQGDDRLFHAIGWRGTQVAVALYVGAHRPQLAREAVLAAFAVPPQQSSDRLALLAGCAPQGETPQGATICSCFAVGEQRIIDAIRQGYHSVAQLGEQLQCGTNCGSCVPELKALLQQYATPDTLRRAG